MEDNKRSFADADREPTPNHDDASRRDQISANMTRRVEYLAPWRMDPSSIKFSEIGPEFDGGCAVVSQAVFSSTLCDPKDHYLELKTGGLMTSNRGFESKVANNGEADGSHEEEQRRNKGVADGQDHECDGETSVGRKPIAVKKMKVKTKSDALKVFGRTIREAEFLISHSHENIIKLKGFVEDLSKNIFWLIFPWEENGTLKEFIVSTECEIPERISLIHDVAKGVEYLHSRNPPICHGDLKSGNILVNSEYRAVLADFGSAHYFATESPNKQTKGPESAGSSEESFCFSTNTITLTYKKYTLRWAAPELLQQDDASPASDVWAFGCVAYEVITELIPFQDVKDGMVVTRIVRGDLPNISGDARMELIQALCTLVGECWNIDPRKRPTAEQCRGVIKWMPMVIPNRVRSAAATNLAGRSAEVLMQLGYMHQRQSAYPNALKCFAGALRLFSDVADRNGKANALLGLAEVHRLQNEYSQAMTLYFECLQIQTDIGNGLGRANALIGLAHMHRVHHEHCQAVKILSECLQIMTDVGDRRGRADALFCLADVHRARSEYSQAVTFYSQCLQIRTDIGDRRGRAEALWGLAEVHRLRNENSQAVTLLSECLQIRTDIGDRQGRAEALWGLAEVHRRRWEYDQAFALLSECLQIRTDIGDRQGRAEALVGLADVHRFRNEYDQAITLYSECLQIRTINGDRQGRAEALWGLAEVHRLRKEYSQALPLLSECLQIRTDVGDRQGRVEALCTLRQVYWHRPVYHENILVFSPSPSIVADLGSSRHISRDEALRNLVPASRMRWQPDESLQTRTDIGDRQRRAGALRDLAETHQTRYEHCRAAIPLSECLQIPTDVGDRRGGADAIIEYSQAVTFDPECLQIRTDICSRRGRAEALWGLAEVYHLRSEYNQAVTFSSECLKIRPNIGGRLGRASALSGPPHAHRILNKYSQAVILHSKLLQMRTGFGDGFGASPFGDSLRCIGFETNRHAARPYDSECLQC